MFKPADRHPLSRAGLRPNCAAGSLTLVIDNTQPDASPVTSAGPRGRAVPRSFQDAMARVEAEVYGLPRADVIRRTAG